MRPIRKSLFQHTQPNLHTFATQLTTHIRANQSFLRLGHIVLPINLLHLLHRLEVARLLLQAGNVLVHAREGRLRRALGEGAHARDAVLGRHQGEADYDVGHRQPVARQVRAALEVGLQQTHVLLDIGLDHNVDDLVSHRAGDGADEKGDLRPLQGWWFSASASDFTQFVDA
jgi:hypothetical protein